MDAAWHEIVACALGRRLREDRRFDFDETPVAEKSPRHLHEPVAQDDVLLKLGPSQIEKTVAESELLRREVFVPRARDRNRRRRRWPDNLERARADLDIARRKIGISHRCRTLDDLALDEDDCLGSECSGRGTDVRRTRSRVERDLHDATSISQIDEREASEIAASVHPAAESNVLSSIRGAECAAQVGTMACREVI
jgi:hypothetical protein